MEIDSDDETSAACAFVECQLTEQDSDTAALNKINSHFEEEPCSGSTLKEKPTHTTAKLQDRVEQSVDGHDAGFVPSESQLCMIKEEGNMNGNLNSSNSTNSRRQKRNGNEKRFKCDVCSKIFTRKYHLKIHLRVHTGEKPFTCAICSKGFSRNEYLALHKRTHTGEKPYKCDLCHTGFSRNDVLTKHVRTHRIRSKPFLCGICQETFSFKRALLRHKRIHRMEGRKVHSHLLEAQAYKV